MAVQRSPSNLMELERSCKEEWKKLPKNRSQSSPAPVGCAGQTSLSPTSQLTGLKGSTANILVPDPTAHLQGSSGVHASTGQDCFGSKMGTNTILGR
ncbi:hypothetical protein QTP70_013286 [Hemibagrus guttatus]|uniref:Uncharacterized protein n=1 Tax=Hemibagrus guttatus TaxID=175788 RepID=A0AAE0QBU7_9TELE|nr:hypothetical protein QTP70_013286 [Hemibagrus guttatus]